MYTDINALTENKIRVSLKEAMNWKVLGVDNIDPEMLK